MAETTPTENPGKPSSPKKKRGGRTLLIAAVAVVAVGGGGTAAFLTMRGQPATTAEESPKAAEPGLLSLEPFVVNLADEGRSRFLRVSVRLVVDGPEQAEHVQKDEVALVRVRSTILELLTQQTAERIVTTEGKAALKQAIGEGAEAALHGTKVIDVLFSDFVVQF